MANFGNIKEEGLLKEGDELVMQVQEQYEEGLLTDSDSCQSLEIWTNIKDKLFLPAQILIMTVHFCHD